MSFGLVGGKGTIPTLAQFPLLSFVVLQLLPRVLPQILQVPGMDADTTTFVRSLRAPCALVALLAQPGWGCRALW